MATSEKLTKETFNPDALDWRDLGLLCKRIND